jgi:hypothetical protein
VRHFTDHVGVVEVASMMINNENNAKHRVISLLISSVTHVHSAKKAVSFVGGFRTLDSTHNPS